MSRLSVANSNRETFAGTIEGQYLRLDRPLGALQHLYIGITTHQGQVDLAGHLSGMSLTGTSNIADNEPTHTAGEFFNFAGQALQVLSLGAPLEGLADTIVVLDPAQGRAFIGGLGGHVPPTASPFQGFREALPMREANVFDRKHFAKATTKLLARRSDDEVTESWFCDPRIGRVYMTLTIDGFTDVMEVLDLPAELAALLAA